MKISDFRILSGWNEKYKPPLSKSYFSWDNWYCLRLAIVSLAVNTGKLQPLVSEDNFFCWVYNNFCSGFFLYDVIRCKFEKLNEDTTLKREASLQRLYVSWNNKTFLMKLNIKNCILLVLLLLVSMVLLKCTNSPLVIYFLSLIVSSIGTFNYNYI